MHVQLYRVKNDGSTEEVGTARVQGGRVVTDTADRDLKHDIEHGKYRTEHGRIGADDGVLFLKVLPRVLSGRRFQARFVEG